MMTMMLRDRKPRGRRPSAPGLTFPQASTSLSTCPHRPTTWAWGKVGARGGPIGGAKILSVRQTTGMDTSQRRRADGMSVPAVKMEWQTLSGRTQALTREERPDISTLQPTGRFYFALTGP